MATVELSLQAEKDLLAVIEYHLDVGAGSFVDLLEEALLEKMRSLESFPRIGREVPEKGDPSIREVFYRNYRIVYQVDDLDQKVTILTIFHSSMDFG